MWLDMMVESFIGNEYWTYEEQELTSLRKN